MNNDKNITVKKLSNLTVFKLYSAEPTGFNSRAEEVDYRQLAHMMVASLSDMLEINGKFSPNYYYDVKILLIQVDSIVCSDNSKALTHHLYRLQKDICVTEG